MKPVLCVLIFLFSTSLVSQQLQILDSLSHEVIPYCTISFGNGLGTFADEEGKFNFSKERYSDVDTLFVSALGYAEKAILTTQLPPKIYLRPEVSQLSEVVLSAPKRGKFKIKKTKVTTHTDLFTSWLPTVESEVAVFFEPKEGKSTQISKLLLPINAEAKYKSKGKGKYATIFRIQFYEHKDGLPATAIPHEKIVFAINEKEDKIFELDIESKSIFIPKEGIFASLQVLGYADAQGRLKASKKYREVKTSRGIQKIATSFRPLLPFSNKLGTQNTYVRRIFFNDKKWQVFDISYNKNSKLIQSGYRNYGMGAIFKVYQD